MVPSNPHSGTNARGLRRSRLLQAASRLLGGRSRALPSSARVRPRLEGLEDRRLLTPTITEFPVPTASSNPWGITAGADGNIWFAEFSANQIGMINPTTHAITEFAIPTANSGPRGITAGPDGNLWFTEFGANQIGVFNLATQTISEFAIPTANANLRGITAGPDGNLWFTEAGADKIGMINPTTHAITEYSVPTARSFPQDIVAGPDGNIWFTEAFVGQVGMIDPTTHDITEFTVIDSYTTHNITAGPDGNIWFTEPRADKIGMINPTTHAISQFSVPYASSSPYGIATGPDGNIWFADNGNSSIGVVSLYANNLVVTAQPPASVTAGSAFSLTVQAQDSSGNVLTSFNGTVTLALASNPGGDTLGGTLTATASAGVATFSGLTLTKAAFGYRITAAASEFGNGITSAFNVTPAAAAQLLIHTQPSATVTAGGAFATQPVVYLTDQYGNPRTGDGTTVITASLLSGAGPLQGTTSVKVSDGIATFTNLADNKAETISLQFTGGGFTSAPSNPIVVKPGLAARLVIKQQPSPTATAGQAFATQPVVYLEDAYGNLRTEDDSTVITASLLSGAGPLQGTTSVKASGGIAAFTNLSDNKAETISLRFNGAGLSSLASGSIVVQPASASQLVIHTQPSATALVNQLLRTQPEIHVQDSYGNLATDRDGAVVTAELSSGAGPLLGTTTAVVSDGVAAFTNLAGGTAETIMLRFITDPLASVISAPVIVEPAVDLRISSYAASPQPIEVGSLLTYTLVVTNNGPSPATNVSVASGGQRNVVANLGTLAAGGSAIATYTVTPSAAGTLTGSVGVASSETDTDPSNNLASVSTTVLDRLGTFQLSAASYAVPENAGSAVITVTRVNGTRGAVTVDYSTVPINARPGLDFTPVSGTLSFPDGIDSQTFVVPVLANPYDQHDELVSVVLSNARSTETLGTPILGTPSTATLTIGNIDPNTSPLVVSSVRWTGSAQSINQILVSFNRPLTVSTAANPANYSLINVGRDGKYGTPDDSHVPMDVAMYQGSRFTVALTPSQSLAANRFFHLQVQGGAAGAVEDVVGNVLAGDGGTPGTSYTALLARGTSLRYYTPAGDQVSLRISGGGLIDDLLSGTGQGVWLSVVGAVPRRTVLSGGIRKVRGGTGQAYLGDTIWGLGKFGDVRVRMPTPPFQISRYPFSPGVDAANSIQPMTALSRAGAKSGPVRPPRLGR